MKSETYRTWRADQHMRGGVKNSPFVSHIGEIRVPTSRLVGAQPHNLLSIMETKRLYDGNDLAEHLMRSHANLY
jgi:hypothetical protein